MLVNLLAESTEKNPVGGDRKNPSLRGERTLGYLSDGRAYGTSLTPQGEPRPPLLLGVSLVTRCRLLPIFSDFLGRL